MGFGQKKLVNAKISTPIIFHNHLCFRCECAVLTTSGKKRGGGRVSRNVQL